MTLAIRAESELEFELVFGGFMVNGGIGGFSKQGNSFTNEIQRMSQMNVEYIVG